MSFGFGVGDIADLANFAWKTYSALKSASKDFRALESEVQSLSISLASFDDSDTKEAIRKYTIGNAQREKRFSDLLLNSRAALEPLSDLVKTYKLKDSEERREVEKWLNGAKFARKNLSVQDFRNKLSIHTTSLNIFLSSLTHFSLSRLERLITADNGGYVGIKDGSGARPGKGKPPMSEDGLDGTWSRMGLEFIKGGSETRDIARELARHREDIVNYVVFLLQGGPALSKLDLGTRLVTTQSITYSMRESQSKLSEDILSSRRRATSQGRSSLMSFVDQMVMFDEKKDWNSDVAVVDEDIDNRVVDPPPIERTPVGTGKTRNSFSNPSPQQAPRIITREPQDKQYSIDEMSRSASEGGSQSRAYKVPPVPMVRTTSGTSPKLSAASMVRRASGTVQSPRMSSISMVRTPSGGQGSPQMATVQMARVPSGGPQSPKSPAIQMVRTASGNTFKPRSPSVSWAVPSNTPQIFCDGADCGRQVVPHEVFFHCQKCAKKGFDICGSCFEQNKRCPGRLAGVCPPMEKMAIVR